MSLLFQYLNKDWYRFAASYKPSTMLGAGDIAKNMSDVGLNAYAAFVSVVETINKILPEKITKKKKYKTKIENFFLFEEWMIYRLEETLLRQEHLS